MAWGCVIDTSAQRAEAFWVEAGDNDQWRPVTNLCDLVSAQSLANALLRATSHACYTLFY